MLQNYLKLALRNLLRQKAFSFINITGLAVGLASSLVIMLWVQDELAYDRFHEKAARTYRLIAAASDLKVAITPVAVAPALEERSADIEHTVRLKVAESVMLENDPLRFEEKSGFYAEPSFFDVFGFRLLYGDPRTALASPNGIILTQEMSLKYFGTIESIGKTLRKDNVDDFVVAGVLADAGGPSHLQFDFLLPWAYVATRDHNIRNNEWGNFDFYTYITFQHAKEGPARHTFEHEVDSLYAKNSPGLEVHFSLQPLTSIHLSPALMGDVGGQGNSQYVAILTIVASFILLIACINFMNLSTARSARRAKEVGLRKAAGAQRIQLIKQFLGESLLITSLSLCIALCLVFIVLPKVNELVNKQLSLDVADPSLLLGLLGIAFFTGLLSGLYPALFLSAFAPIKVLRKELKGGTGGVVFRNVLVVSQFVISIVLLVGTGVVYQQLDFIRKKDLGFNREHLLYVKLHGDAYKQLNKWRAAFDSDPLTSPVTFTSGLPTNYVSGTAGVEWPGKDPDQQLMFATLYVDENFIPLYDMDIVSGRNYNASLLGDSANFLINETAARVMGMSPETAVGAPLTMWKERKGTIVGVVKDFHFKPLQDNIEPMILMANTWGAFATIKADANKIPETIQAMEKVWNSIESVYPFSFSFVDQDIDNLYQSERQVGTLFSVFAFLAILISCLGLYGLSAYIAEQRTKEIGIRKALGASVMNIIYLLNTRFVVPVLVAMIIATPIAYFSMQQWLSNFAYKIPFNWTLLIGAGLVSILISVLTVSYESLKAAMVNPVKSLRTE